MRRYWKSAMSAVSRSATAKGLAQDIVPASIATRYVGGADAVAGAERASVLLGARIRASLCFLGTPADSPDWAKQNTAAAVEAARQLAQRGLDVHFSIDPSQAGLHLDCAVAMGNLTRIGQVITEVSEGKPGIHVLMLGMEEAALTDATLSLHQDLVERQLRAGITLQAYRRRSEADLMLLLRRGARVRLVKGAYPAGSDIAFIQRDELQAAWRRLIDLMLSRGARDSGFYPVVATHDRAIQDHARNRAAANGWKQGEYEIEMLMGIRDEWARKLAHAGERVRLYVPFGTDWWPYTFRRIGDNPRNAWLLLRSLVSRE
jgi:proline dehydrogenase